MSKLAEIPLSSEPLRFGSKAEFQRALTELRYLERMYGRLRRDDLCLVAEKYSLPIDFLKEGLKGVSFPDDFMISKSKWFPILYRWAVGREEAIRELTLLTTRHLRAQFLFAAAPIYTVLAFAYAAYCLYEFANQTLLNVFIQALFPLILFIIPLLWELYLRVDETGRELEEHRKRMTNEGMITSISGFDEFRRKHYRTILYAGHILARKPLVNLFQVGALGEKNDFIPVFYAENPHLDYQTRLAKFLRPEKNTKESAT